MQKHPLDNYIQDKIKEELDKHDTIIKEEDAQKIMEALIPSLEKIVAQKIKLHLTILAEYLLESLAEKEEIS
jgi:cell fate (sporulation/competence/biofilm development) regulator YlbF (YheA/YmcA/DUF963 family)